MRRQANFVARPVARVVKFRRGDDRREKRVAGEQKSRGTLLVIMHPRIS